MYCTYLTMKIYKYYDIKLIEEVWRDLYNNNGDMTPFQSFEWNLQLQNKSKNIINRILRFFRGQFKIEYWIFRDDECIVIAPLIIYYKKDEIFILGQQDMSDYLSFIFMGHTPEIFLMNCIKVLRKEYFQFSFIFDRIIESNIKMRDACIKSETAHIQEKNCVKIEITDQLFMKINSDSRRYWKQAKKRLEDDNLELAFSFNETVIEDREINTLLHHYLKRRVNKLSVSILKQFLMRILQFLHYKTGNKNDMVSLFVTNNAETLIAKCKISNCLSAYMICCQRDETLYVLRISIDDNFSIYRPGILLIVETVNYLFKNKPLIKYLDFSRGDESYKLNYGGLIHHNYCFYYNPFQKANMVQEV